MTIFEYVGVSLQVSNKDKSGMEEILSHINRLGSEGWEMVAAATVDIVEGGFLNNGNIIGKDSVLWFKRSVG